MIWASLPAAGAAGGGMGACTVIFDALLNELPPASSWENAPESVTALFGVDAVA